MAPISAISPETVDRVVAVYSDDFSFLKHSALVCRSFRHPAQRRMFKTVKLLSPERVNDLLDLMETNLRLCIYIKTVYVDVNMFYMEDEFVELLELMNRTVEAANLEVVVLSQALEFETLYVSRKLPPATDIVSAFQRVTVLVLDCLLWDLDFTMQMVHCCRALRNLSLRRVDFSRPKNDLDSYGTRHYESALDPVARPTIYMLASASLHPGDIELLSAAVDLGHLTTYRAECAYTPFMRLQDIVDATQCVLHQCRDHLVEFQYHTVYRELKFMLEFIDPGKTPTIVSLAHNNQLRVLGLNISVYGIDYDLWRPDAMCQIYSILDTVSLERNALNTISVHIELGLKVTMSDDESSCATSAHALDPFFSIPEWDEVFHLFAAIAFGRPLSVEFALTGFVGSVYEDVYPAEARSADCAALKQGMERWLLEKTTLLLGSRVRTCLTNTDIQIVYSDLLEEDNSTDTLSTTEVLENDEQSYRDMLARRNRAEEGEDEEGEGEEEEEDDEEEGEGEDEDEDGDEGTHGEGEEQD